MILLCNMQAHPALVGIRALCAMKKYPLRMVAEEEYSLTLQDLALGKQARASDAQAAPAFSNPLEMKPSFSEPMLIFAGMSQPQIAEMLDQMKVLHLPKVDLKAVMTPTNARWNIYQMQDALMEEHRALHS